MKLPFLDRQTELRVLRALLDTPEPVFGVLYGRRRCGKSRLLQQLDLSNTVYYLADQSDHALQRVALVAQSIDGSSILLGEAKWGDDDAAALCRGLENRSPVLFPKKAINAIEDNDLFISPIVFLELNYLFEIKKISLQPDHIINELGATMNLVMCDKPFRDIILQVNHQKWTRDPFDRIITAQAIVSRSPLITKDSTIRSHYKRALWD